jgi:hypothetical protein
MLQDLKVEDGYEGQVGESDTSPLNESDSQIGSSTIKRRRDKLLEEARKSVPEPGSGRVMHLVKAFEKLLSIPSSKDSDEKEEKEEEENKKEAMKWALPGLQVPKVAETQFSSSSFCPSDLFLTSENLGLDSRISVSSSWDSSQGRWVYQFDYFEFHYICVLIQFSLESVCASSVFQAGLLMGAVGAEEM